jgi:histidine triad (HIT) family protein
MDNDCIFCKVAENSIPARVIWADTMFMAFHDINPKAPIHILIIPKKHISQLSVLNQSDSDWLGAFMLAIIKVAEILHLDHYKVNFNNGSCSGQEIFHLHAHLLQY